MSPHLRKHPVDAVLARLRASGDAEAAAVLAALRDAIAAQDDALRDLVADARRLDEEFDEGGRSTVDIECAEGSFDALAAAFGYPAVQGFDRAEFQRAKDSPGGPEMYDGQVHLTPLDHLLARTWTEAAPTGGTPRGIPVEVPAPGGGRETVYHDKGAAPAAAPAP